MMPCSSALTVVDSQPALNCVRIKAKKCDSSGRSDTLDLRVSRDQMTYEKLRQLIRQHFIISDDFVLFYLMPEGYGRSGRYVPILSEWDVHAAVFVASDQTLVLKVDVKSTDPLTDALHDWDILDTDDFPDVVPSQLVRSVQSVPASGSSRTLKLLTLLFLWPHSLRNHFQTGSSLPEEAVCKKPLTLSEYCNFLDADGRLISPERLRLRIFQGGCEACLRSTIWPFLLGVFPNALSSVERQDYLRKLCKDYYELRQCWVEKFHSRTVVEEMRLVLNAIRKDVVRTDRRHPFYAGDEENNANLLSLFNLLATYAIYHPDVSYCQGMSDLASPLLVVMEDEASAYILFCALMRRLRGNFQYDGRLMTTKFKDLCGLLDYFDAEFYDYLRETHADDLLFCYRWLLLEMKREFSFDDALCLMEVNWASMDPSDLGSLQLHDSQPAIVDQALCNSCLSHMHVSNTPTGNEQPAYKLAAFGQDDSLDTGRPIYFQSRHRLDSLSSCHSCPACLADFNRSNLHVNDGLLSLMESVSSLYSCPNSDLSVHDDHDDDSQSFWKQSGPVSCKTITECQVNDDKRDGVAQDEGETLESPVPLGQDVSTANFYRQFTMSEIQEICDIRPPSSCNCSVLYAGRSRQASGSANSCFEEQVKSRHPSTATNVIDSGFAESHTALRTPTATSKMSMGGGSNRVDKEEMVVDETTGAHVPPAPRSKRRDKLGGGNPFLLFICVTVVLQHRDLIMQRKMEFNDIAVYFDAQMKRHNVNKVLRKARQLYARYNEEISAARKGRLQLHC